MASQEPLKILSIDGGGIRGISSLLILEDIMEKIRDKNGLGNVPRPCEHFDLIGGSGTGGIIAIMLGRLQMTVNECIQAYRDIAEQAFSWKPTPSSSGNFRRKVVSMFKPKSMSDAPTLSTSAFSAKRLEDAIKFAIRRFCVEAECKSRRNQGKSTARTCPHENMLFRNKTCTKTVVLAITGDNIDAPPTLLKTYDSSATFESCTIWQVARATSAAVGFFDSIRLGRDDIEFIDAAFGYNNPCEVLIQEARKQFPERHQMRILSIGTGLGDVITIKGSPELIMNALRSMVTSSKWVARRLNDRFDDDTQYVRFNVDRGLEDITLSDWEKVSTISAHTRNYLAENERTIRRFVDNLHACVAASGGGNKLTAGRVHFAVPFGRNKGFVGRESILEQLLATVPPSVEADDCQKTAVVGLGGVGKTQIALEVAFRVREKHPDCSVFWVPALDTVSFRNAYRSIGQLLGIDGINDDKADVEELVKMALSNESTGSWLLIVDSADSPSLFDDGTDLAHHLPFSRQGSLLFTSRNHELVMQLGVPALNVFNVQGMSENEGIRLLETHLTEHQMSNRDDTAKLLDVLGYLPLAIRQASAYMAKKQISTAKYLDLCRSSDKNMVELLSRDFEDSHRYREAQNPIAATWLISFRQIADHDPLAADYLKFMCFLGEKAIPRALLPKDAWTLEAEDAIGTLKAYAFITEGKTPDKYDIHRLVQIAMLNWLDKQGEFGEWAVNVIRRIEEVFPVPALNNREILWDYLPHARRILERQTTIDDVAANLSFKAGHGFHILGQYREAETMRRLELEGREKMLGPDHPRTLASVNNLGAVLEEQGQYKQAEKMHQRALKGREKTLGRDHPDTLTSISNLGIVLQKQGQYEKAEAMYRRALEGREKVLGLDHPKTLASVNNLGNILEEQQQYEKAEAMHRRALEGLENVLGPDDPSTLTSVNNLGSTLASQGRFKMAEAMYRRALEGREKVLGCNHPDTFTSVNNMGSVLESQGQYEMAEAMYRRALEGREKVLGPDHPKTLSSIDNLGKVLERQGQYERAEIMYRQALERRERVLGYEHPNTLTSASNLANVLERRGQHEIAEAMYRRVLEGRERTLGPDHPQTLASIDNLAVSLQNQGQYEKAEAMHRRALEGQEKVLGRDHPDTLDSIDYLGTVLVRQGQYKQAEAMYRRALEGREKVLGPDHPSTLTSIDNMAVALQTQGQYEEAETMHKRAVEGREKVLGHDHPDTLDSVNNLAIALQNQEKYVQAEALNRRVLEGREKALGREHPATLASVNNLAITLQGQEEYEKAEAMHRRALEGREKVLGPNHPDTLDSLDSLGSVLESQGQYEKAEEMYRRAVDGMEKTLGSNHPDTLDSMDNLVRILQRQQKHEEAEVLRSRVRTSSSP